MALMTPLAGAGESRNDGDADALQLIAATAAAETVALRGRLRRTPLRFRSVRLWLPVIDVVVTAAVISVPAGVTGPAVISGPVALVFALAWGLALASAGGWSAQRRTTSRRAVLRAGALAGLACWVSDALLVMPVAASQLVALTFALMLATLLPRLVLLAVTGERRPTRLAVAGDAADVRRLVDELGRESSHRWEVSSVCLEADEPDGVPMLQLDGVPTWNGVHQVVDAATATGASAILLAPGRALCPETARRLSWHAHRAGLEVYVGTGLLDVLPTRAQLVRAGDLGLVHLRAATAPSPSRIVKAVAERLIAAFMLALLLPILTAVALAVRLDSPGSALFRQTRVGRDGEEFTMLKFRTMTDDAELHLEELTDDDEGAGVLFKIRCDPRITRVGGVLRRYSLDELPQLVNVLRGAMSLVGPRPALPDEVARYDTDPQRRLAVKPGLTGLWQVSGRSDLSWEESVRLDLHYVDNWSLGLDARILLRTVHAVLGHRGAY